MKLQRNALSVLEHPTGNEQDITTECEFESSSSSDIAAAPKDHLHRMFMSLQPMPFSDHQFSSYHTSVNDICFEQLVASSSADHGSQNFDMQGHGWHHLMNQETH